MNTSFTPFAQPPKSLYIHWPFCAFKCHFCDFISFEKHEHFHDIYHKALCNEITSFAKSMPDPTSYEIESIFFGGGTPSLYPLKLLRALFGILHDHYNLKNIKEITIEANPADITEEKIATWQELGINRLSLGVQILDNQALYKLNRRQRNADVHRAIKLTPHYFKNISVDLMLGIPEVSEATWAQTIEQVVTWPITHISMYFLTIHEKTPLFFKTQQNIISNWQDELLLETYQKSVDFLAAHGFKQYEISNFAQPGYESIHNQNYWNRKPFRGFGLNAASFDGSCRYFNEKNLENYLNKATSNNNVAYSFVEKLTDEQTFTETLMLGLRQAKGVSLHDVVYSLKEEKRKHFYEKLAELKAEGFIEDRNETIRLTHKGIILENEIVLKLL